MCRRRLWQVSAVKQKEIKQMWKSLKDLPTLIELFFSKGVDPTTYKGKNNTPAYLTGKGKKSKKSTSNKKPVSK